jgi:hypothetical protein
MWHEWGIELRIGFWFENLRERDNSKDLGVDGRIILKQVFNKSVGMAWTGLIWLRKVSGGGML